MGVSMVWRRVGGRARARLVILAGLAAVAVAAAIAPLGHSDSAGAYEQATAYTRQRSFAAARVVEVSSPRQLARALFRLRPGDLVEARSPFTVSGGFGIENIRLSSPAEIDLSGVSFTGGPDADAAVQLTNDSNLRIYGGDVSNPKDYGILVYSTDDVRWWGFTIHDVGGSGLAMFPVDGDIRADDFAGAIRNWGNNLAIDDHEEKGTGLQGAILADARGSYVFDNNRLALDESDGPTGSGVEIGDSDGSEIAGNTLYLRVRHLTMRPTTQFAGNGLQVWGASRVGLTVPYLEASDLQGRAALVWQAPRIPDGVRILRRQVRDTCLDRAECARTSPP